MSILRTVVVGTGLAALVVAAAGCTIALDTLEDGSISAVALTDIHVTGGAGDVTVQPDDSVHGVDIRRMVRYRGSKPGQTYRINGATLTLDTNCPGVCTVSYVVRVPTRGTGTGIALDGDNGSGDAHLTGLGSVDLRLGSGNITVSDVAGPVTVKTGSGDVKVIDATGNVSITTSSGNVTGQRLAGARTTVDVSSGDITLDLPGTGDVVARTDSGDINAAVPDRSVQVSLETGSGDRRVDITPNPDSPHHLELHSGSGDITVHANG